MTVLVTGADGFIGSHMVQNLLMNKKEVLALCMYNSHGSSGWLDYMPKNQRLRVVHGDIRNPHFIKRLCKDADACIHLAALISVPHSIHTADDYIHTNIQGTTNILEGFSSGGHVVVVSSSEIYGGRADVPLNEGDEPCPLSPYAVSKLATEQLTRCYYLANKITSYNIVRPFNTYGPRQSERAIVGSFIRQALDTGIIRMGNTTSKRDMVYVTDTCAALERLLYAQCGVYNIATGQTHTVFDIAKKIADIVGDIKRKEITIETDDIKKSRDSSWEVRTLTGDSTKLHNNTTWRPRVYLDEGLRRTVEWAMKRKIKRTSYEIT